MFGPNLVSKWRPESAEKRKKGHFCGSFCGKKSGKQSTLKAFHIFLKDIVMSHVGKLSF